MAEPRAIGNYGGIKEDAAPVENTKSQVSAGEWNRKSEDTAQMTRTSAKAIVSFTTDAAGGTPFNLPANTIGIKTQWGNGDSYKPTISKTSDPGRYSLTFAAAYVDALGDQESLGFFEAKAWARSSDPLDHLDVDVLSVGSNVVTVAVKRRDTQALVDEGNNSAAVFQVIVEIY